MGIVQSKHQSEPLRNHAKTSNVPRDLQLRCYTRSDHVIVMTKKHNLLPFFIMMNAFHTFRLSKYIKCRTGRFTSSKLIHSIQMQRGGFRPLCKPKPTFVQGYCTTLAPFFIIIKIGLYHEKCNIPSPCGGLATGPSSQAFIPLLHYSSFSTLHDVETIDNLT